MERRLAERSVIVTGGGSGSGKGVCQRISEEGALVIVADKRLDLAEAVASGLRSSGGQAIPVDGGYLAT